ncbi:hypothetical protein AVEN_36136-1 [Araneus ventricosus]|uniref:Uncharacterized protein n=1 Tax=Araneus ventricosus TaxID=182803 RepID=A0A4Y2EIX2_ARAVE|nr:hypothetical protein AVEN_36136-1 [Araneus ventricosus]
MQTTQPVTSFSEGYCALSLLPLSKWDHPPSSHESASLPSPHFMVFAFVREAPSPSRDSVSVLWPRAPNGNPDRMKIQTFRSHRANSHRILVLTTGFGTTGSKWCGTELS